MRGFRGKGVIKGAHLSVYDLDKVEGEFVLRADSERSTVAVACPTHFWWRVESESELVGEESLPTPAATRRLGRRLT